MPRGPQEARLDRAVSGAARSAIQAAEEEWRNGARSLDNVAMALEMAGPQVVANFGGTHTGPAAQQAFRKVAEKVRARKEQMERAADALAQADVAVGEAKQVQASLGALPHRAGAPRHRARHERRRRGPPAADLHHSTGRLSRGDGRPRGQGRGSGQRDGPRLPRLHRDHATGPRRAGRPQWRRLRHLRWQRWWSSHHRGRLRRPAEAQRRAHLPPPAPHQGGSARQPRLRPAAPRTSSPPGCHGRGDLGPGHSPGRDGPSTHDLGARDRRCDRLRARRELDQVPARPVASRGLLAVGCSAAPPGSGARSAVAAPPSPAPPPPPVGRSAAAPGPPRRARSDAAVRPHPPGRPQARPAPGPRAPATRTASRPVRPDARALPRVPRVVRAAVALRDPPELPAAAASPGLRGRTGTRLGPGGAAMATARGGHQRDEDRDDRDDLVESPQDWVDDEDAAPGVID